MKDYEFAAVKSETKVWSAINIAAAVFMFGRRICTSMISFYIGFSAVSLLISLLLTIPSLIINIRNKSKCSDAVYYKFEGAGRMEKLCVINIILSVIFLLTAVGKVFWIFYAGSHF